MIAIARSLCRDLRAAIRTLGTGRPMTLPPLEFVAGRGGLLIRCRGPEIAVLVRYPSRFPETRLLVPAAALADCEGSDETPVTFQTGPSGRVAVGWFHGGKATSPGVSGTRCPRLSCLPGAACPVHPRSK